MKVTKELRALSSKELHEKLGEFKKELLKLNAQVSGGGQASNPGQIKQIKKNIARVLTLQKEKEAPKN
ncbi:50S ribosomal protein L29 [Candidatus Woesearchaeota archaeon]|jgi:large subunit ribosomal protein L29|nr:50S ribosomal protein L29 [Candidatus Woesearchaeota archaeon]MBT4151276.1 50S ribosomal protein L29 [Candidatus Woesearchaeota archaeon]MBT4247590.1 50S ribosomal protein L29 [Candidatus Woesearchaeota archaeon]MBT4433964.1 50S ribosomal protein L29 [Candidatus Woesearchaeota archaeon]MBT7332361.1 50S ribosomal protein L29 [Candidatus Woesearchaeota archaeon]